MRVPSQRHHSSDPCDVLVGDDRPLVATAIAAVLRTKDVGTVATSVRVATLADDLLRRQPRVVVLSGPSTARMVSAVRVVTTLRDVAVVAVLEADQPAAELQATVDVVLGAGTGVDQLVQAVHRARAGERFVAGLRTAAPRREARTIRLTEREQEVLHLMADGASNQAIAGELQIGINTVRTHVRAVLRKLGEHRRLAAVRRAAELGLLDQASA